MGRKPKYTLAEQEYIQTHSLDDLCKKWPTTPRNTLLATKRYWTNRMEKQPRLPEEIEENFITRAKPTVIRPTRRRQPVREDYQLSILLGDAQIGFRGAETFHDETAMALAQLAIRELMPNNVVFTGDMIDLTAQSRWEQRSDWATRTQDSIDRYHAYLAETRANIGKDGKIVVVHGNHEQRLDTSIQRDAASLLGLRRANSGHELPVLTIQNLARYDDLGVQSVDGYPNAAYWLEDNLKVTHGQNAVKGGSNAAKYLAQEDTSTIYGHSHRMEVAYRTRATRFGQRVVAAASPGALCRTDGGVPGFNYTVNNEGATVPKAEDWQQGILLVRHNAQHHDITPVRFNGNSMRINDKVYEV